MYYGSNLFYKIDNRFRKIQSILLDLE